MKAYALDIGVSTEHLTTMRIELRDGKYTTVDARREARDDIEEAQTFFEPGVAPRVDHRGSFLLIEALRHQHPLERRVH